MHASFGVLGFVIQTPVFDESLDSLSERASFLPSLTHGMLAQIVLPLLIALANAATKTQQIVHAQ